MKPRFVELAFAAAVAVMMFQASARADSYKVEAAHSTVIFRVKHVSASYYNGRFNDISGTIEFDPANPSSSSINLAIAADSVDTNNEQRDAHLRGPDFLNVKQFPTITFKSESVRKSGESTYSVTGKLSIRGVTRTVTASVEHVGSSEIGQFGPRTGFSTRITINRRDFNVNYGTDEVVGDNVELILDIEAIPK